MRIRRIVAGLHPGQYSGRLLEAAARRARAMDAELIGLYIEDVELLHFAAMPFAREIGTTSGRPRPVDAAAMERYMSARAAELRAALSALAGRIPVNWSFRVARGTVAEGLLAAVSEQHEPALIVPPGADIEASPRIVPRPELELSLFLLCAQERRPLLLLPEAEP